MLHAVIMAGGAGTRFWPASRAGLPKQLLELTGGRTMIQATVDRLSGLVPPERILVVTNQQLVDPVRQQLPQVPPEAVIGEPCKRDTAPCVGLAGYLVAKHDPDAVLLVLPADHVIRSVDRFQSAVSSALQIIDAAPSRIVTFGIAPSYPADSFGYIERGDNLAVNPVTGNDVGGRVQAFRAVKFREKPSVAVAKEWLATGRFYWNSGMFVWRARTILGALEQFEPQMSAHLAKIAKSAGTPGFSDTFHREFAEIKGKSIDYAVMEHYPEVVVIEAPFDWDDVGNWRSLERLRGTDPQGNTIIGRHLGINTSNTTVRTTDAHLVATVGVDNLIVVHTPDATLVVNKNDEESMRKVVQLLNERGWTEYL